MAYVDPTPGDLRTRFPAFAAVSDGAVQSALDEAARRVDVSWPDAERRTGAMLYAAHVLVSDGLGASTEAQLAGFRSIAVGSLRLEREPGPVVSTDALSVTTYGRRFISLAGLLFSGPVLV